MSYFSFTALFENQLPIDLISAWAFREGCDGIEEGQETVTLYFHSDETAENLPLYNRFFKVFNEAKILKPLNRIAAKNWNEEWKKYFKPVKSGKFVILPPWEKSTKNLIPILIYPKMAFGTGTHESTQLILEAMEESQFKNKKILDIGCGSGILSIAAGKLGASEITGIDIASEAIENANENARLNNAHKCHFFNGDQNFIKEKNFDIIFANIIASVLKLIANDIACKIKPGGIILLSGLLQRDTSEIEKIYSKEKFELISINNKNEWYMMKFKKSTI